MNNFSSRLCQLKEEMEKKRSKRGKVVEEKRGEVKRMEKEQQELLEKGGIYKYGKEAHE